MVALLQVSGRGDGGPGTGGGLEGLVFALARRQGSEGAVACRDCGHAASRCCRLAEQEGWL